MTYSRPKSELAASGRATTPGDLQTLAAAIGSLSLGLIDADLLRRECLLRALDGLQSGLTVQAFAQVEDLGAAAAPIFDLLICQVDSVGDSEAAHRMRAVCGAVDIPVIVLSDAAASQQAQAIRLVLKSGARGFIATRTTGLAMMLAALRFVAAGGTFAPLDLLLDAAPAREETPSAEPAPLSTGRFTARQSAVLGLLRQGKANKIIAHELGMSESTVKVHVRNIMRTIGATNRTEVAYRLQNTQLAAAPPA